MTSPNPSGVTVPPPDWYDPHNFVAAAPELQHSWVPQDSGLLAAVGPLDAALGQNTGALVAATLYLVKIFIRRSITVTNGLVAVQAAGVGASTNTRFGLYDPAGNLLATTADISATLSLAGLNNSGLGGGPFTGAPVPVAPPFVWLAMAFNFATTQPSLFRSGGVGSLGPANAPGIAATLRYATNGTAAGALPATINPASNTSAGALTQWAALQ